MKRFIKNISLTLIIITLIGLNSTSFAWMSPQVENVSNLNEFLSWYNSGSNSCNLTAEIKIGREVILSSDKPKDIGCMAYPLRVVKGGHLIINATKTNIIGSGLEVQQGGGLTLINGGVWGNRDEPSSFPAIVIRKGGTLTKYPSFMLEGGILNQNVSEDVIISKPEEEVGPDIFGEVAKLTARNTYVAVLTVPRIPDTVKTIWVKRGEYKESLGRNINLSKNMEIKYTFLWNEDFQCFIAQGSSGLMTKVNYEKNLNYIQYEDSINNFPCAISVSFYNANGTVIDTPLIKLEIPKNAPNKEGYYPTRYDYYDMDGNRGGGGQGETVRNPDSSVDELKEKYVDMALKNPFVQRVKNLGLEKPPMGEDLNLDINKLQEDESVNGEDKAINKALAKDENLEDKTENDNYQGSYSSSYGGSGYGNQYYSGEYNEETKPLNSKSGLYKIYVTAGATLILIAAAFIRFRFKTTRKRI